MSHSANIYRLMTVVAALGAASPAFSQAVTPITVNTAQSLVGVAVGTGMVQGQAVASVNPGATPLIGVGALSGKIDHFGSLLSVSLLNNERLVGVDIGPNGINSPTSISIPNPKQAPILSK